MNERAQHSALRIRLLGATHIVFDGRRLEQHFTDRTLLLLAAIVKHQGEPLSREQLAFALWPDHSEEEARANLRRHLYRLARILPPAADPWIVADARSVSWPERKDAWIDVVEFERLSADNRSEEALQLYGGELLPRVDHEWAEKARARLQALACYHLERAIAERRSRGDFEICLEYVEQLLAFDPWREDMLRNLMHLRYHKGDRGGALAAYREFCRKLLAEFDVAPMPQTVQCYESIARGHAPSEESHPSRIPQAVGLGA
jgi:DNA-binding SARP family transcriptional activator